MTDTLLTLSKSRSVPTRVPPLLQDGFRPFFLLAALVGAVSIVAWLAVLRGALVLPLATVDVHVHEMVFGFAVAVIAGFLLTAVRNWTGVNPAPPVVLAALVTLYVAGRIAVALEAAGVARGASVVEALFLPALVAAIALPVLKKGDRRNYGVVALVGALAAIDIAMHVAAWAAASSGSSAATWPASLALSARAAALLAPCVLVAVIGGRVIPLFTNNVVSNDGVKVRARSHADTVALVGAVLVLACAAAAPWFAWVARVEPFVDVGAGLALLWRMRGWASFATRTRPILWILHAGYACLGVGFVLRGLPTAWVPPTAASHVLAIGAIAVPSLGMMTRVALGHTGRALVVPPLAIVAYGAMVGAVVVRVAAAWWPALLDAAGALFALALLLFLVAYARALVAPRVDAKPG